MIKYLLALLLSIAAAPACAGACANASAANVVLGSGCEVIISTSGSQTNIPGAGGLAVTYGVTAATFTATSYSSAPVVYISTIQAGNQLGTNEDIAIMDASGNTLIYTDGGSSHGVRLNQQTFTGSRVYDIEEFGTTGTGVTIGLRGRDTSVLAGDLLGRWAVRDADTSTNGSTEKASCGWYAGGVDWTSNNSMESEYRCGTSRNGGSVADRLIMNSTSTIVQSLVIGGQGSTLGTTTQVICTTCAFDARGNGSISGTLNVISTATAKYVAGAPYDLSGQSPSAPTASYELMKVISPRDLTLQFDLSLATAAVKAAATTTIDIQVNAASIGRVRWSVDNTSGTFTLTGSATITRGDIITFVAPATPDTTLSGISWNLAAITR